MEVPDPGTLSEDTFIELTDLFFFDKIIENQRKFGIKPEWVPQFNDFLSHRESEITEFLLARMMIYHAKGSRKSFSALSMTVKF